MGEVFKARDTRLDRSVAIKVLPADFAQNAQLKLRFEREAKTISQLNHPHICTLHDVGQENGVEFLVMELIEGESLADRVVRGPLPLEQLLKVGIEIADALERAHRSGVIHRDLKPGNVMLTKSGAKLLDFGLAKPGGLQVSNSELTQELTQKAITQEGTIVGTFQYMAPEQIEGREADPRTDIFALGCVLYEMATGHRAFDGKSRASLIASILDREPPPISSIQPMAPASLEHVIRKCLEKDPDARWQNAHDVAETLHWIAEQRADVVTKKRRSAKPWIAATAALALVALALAALMFAGRRDAKEPHLELAMAVPSLAYYEDVTLSPDGKRVVFRGYTDDGKPAMLWLRSLDSGSLTVIPGTESGTHPFWSPDGRQIAFFAGGKVKRVPADGGPVQTICDAAEPDGGAWSADGTILVGRDTLGPLDRVSATGGTPQPATKLGPKEEGHRWPVFLPDGDHFLFLGDAWLAEDHHLKIGSLKTGATRDLIQGISNLAYVKPGWLLYVRGQSLIAQRFDEKKLAFAGEPQVIAEQIVQSAFNHHFDFSASDNGRLTYRSANPKGRLTWVDRNGKRLQVVGGPRAVGDYALSPDERNVVFMEIDTDQRPDDLWQLDLVRGTTRRITSDPAGDYAPAWSPDGTMLAFGSNRAGLGDIYIGNVSQAASEHLALKAKDGATPTHWLPNGDIVIEHNRGSDVDIYIYSTKTGEAKPYIATPFLERAAMVSPDGQRIAYVSRESGRTEVFVERYPSHAERRQVSNNGGDFPQWRKDGKELFFLGDDLNVMSVDLTDENAVPKALFRGPAYMFRVSGDGQRFLINDPLQDVSKVPVTVITNWQSRLKAQ